MSRAKIRSQANRCHDYEEKTCSGHGVCKKLVETYSCKCFAGWANDKADCDTEPTLNFFLCILFAWVRIQRPALPMHFCEAVTQLCGAFFLWG